MTYRSRLSCTELGSDFFVSRLKITSVAGFSIFVVGFGIISITGLKLFWGLGVDCFAGFKITFVLAYLKLL